MDHLHVEFCPVDPLNPDFGYRLTILDRFGRTLLRTATAPDTGDELKTPADCLRVLQQEVRINHTTKAPER